MIFETALAEATHRATHGATARLFAIGGDVDLDPFTQLSDERELFFWSSDEGMGAVGSPMVAFGCAALLKAEGADAIATVRQSARELFTDLEVVGSAAPRLLGGLSFAPGRLGVFQHFGDARFVLPRWSFVRSGNSVRAELVVSRTELEIPRLLQAEAHAVFANQLQANRVTSPLCLEASGAPEYCSAARAALEQIAQGALEKVVVVRAARASGQVSVAATLRRLSAETAAAHFAISAGTHTFVGASPELLVAFDGQALRSEAVAGTLPRRGEDAQEIAALLASDKDEREHRYVVRAIETALANAGARIVSQAERHVRTLRHVHHLATPIVASAPDSHVLDWVDALHPTPAVCGVPRREALSFLLANERFDRGWFAAPVGWFDAQGRGQFAVALRSALLVPGGAHLFAGAGLVRGSEVEFELAETEAKLASMRGTLGVVPDPAPAPLHLGGVA